MKNKNNQIKVNYLKRTWIILLTTLILTATLGGYQNRVQIKNNESPLNAKEQRKWRKVLKAYDYTGIATVYADYMIKHGRDRYGEIHSPLFVTVMDRKTATVYTDWKLLKEEELYINI